MAKPQFDPNKPFSTLQNEKPPFDPSKSFEFLKAPEEQTTLTQPEAALIGLQKGASLGLRPVIAGAGAGLGSAYGEAEKGIKKGEGLSEYISRITQAIPKAYEQGRLEALKEQETASKEYPKTTFATDIAGSALLMPFTPVKSIGQAARLGAAQGATKALSEEQSLPESAKSIALGGALGAGSYQLAKGIEAGYPKLKEGIKSVTDFLGEKSKNAFIKTASALTGESDRNIRTFIEKNDAVEKLISESGGDIGVAADQIRTSLQKQIQNFRRNQNSVISESLDNISQDKVIPKDTLIAGLDRIKSKINPHLKPEEIGQIDEMVTRINNVAGENGALNLKEVYEIQDFLYDRAKGAYMKNGQIFMPGKLSQQAAKSGAREAKLILDDMVPELRSANENLSKLHKIEENINKNLIAPGKSESALLAAGSATSGRNKIYLEQLGKILGKDVVGEAEKLSSTAAFSSPQIMPKSSGGTTSTTRTLTSAAIGGIAGGPIGAAITTALTSPLALKQAINVGLFSKDVLKKTLGESINLADEKVLQNIINYMNTPQGQFLLNRATQNVNEKFKDNAVNRRLEFINQGQ